MQEPPVMVSTKDCMYISDILNMSVAIVKKFKHYDSEINDVQIKQLVGNITNQMKNQYSTLLEVLNG